MGTAGSGRAKKKDAYLGRVVAGRVTVAESAGDDLPAASLTGPQGSGILSSMAAADGLLVGPEGTAELPEGAVAEFLPFR